MTTVVCDQFDRLHFDLQNTPSQPTKQLVFKRQASRSVL